MKEPYGSPREAQLYEGLALSAPPKGNHHLFLASVVFWYTPLAELSRSRKLIQIFLNV